MEATPVTVLSGSLGAGKTTLLNHLLATADRDIAVLINDMGEINVDADLVSDRSELSVADGTVTELSNGCICCELRDDLETAVVRLARERSFDHLVVESSGISEPGPVAKLFTTGSAAAARYDIDALVTVVDARLFVDTFGGEDVPRRSTTNPEGDDDPRPLADLLVEQVEFSNVVLLNKCDLVSDAEAAEAESLIRALRPDIDVIRTVQSAVSPDRLLGRGLYDQGTGSAAGWKRKLQTAADHGHDPSHDGDHDHDDHDTVGHSHPEAVYGVTSFSYRRRRPFHPGRLATLFGDLPASVIRSKGTCWVAGRERHPISYSQAGPSVHVEVAGRWIASLPEVDQELYRSNRSDLDWDDEWGDRRTELVFIGRDVDEASLVASLDDCLLTDAELDAEWNDFENPFPTEPEDRLVLAEP